METSRDLRMRSEIARSIMHYEVHFESTNDNGDWEKVISRTATFTEAQLKVNAINKRMDMRNPIIVELYKNNS